MTNEPTPAQPLVVGIGASAGGIDALVTFFEQVPPDSGMAFIVILHLSPDHDSQLIHILQGVAQIPVLQVTQKQTLRANQVYVMSPNQHLQMVDGLLDVFPNQQLAERRAPVDIFLRTLADTYGTQAVAVVLSGSGANGSMGLKRVKEQGGAVFVQSPGEAAFSEMPRHALATGLVDASLPAAQIPAHLLTYQKRLGTAIITGEADQRPLDQQQALREVFTLLRQRTGHDFTNYKRQTLLRRLERRISVLNLTDLPAYTYFLQQHPGETQALLKDFLISVTNFFRDSTVFATLESLWKTTLLADKKVDDTLRIWIAGCATGEEAYSLAMLCVEQLATSLEAPKIQFFATDIDEAAIATAREGLYTLNDVADVSPERLRRFFVQEGNQYRVGREIREMILFAHHNVLKDPPFSQLDLVSCRNLMIYFNATAQERVLETFHFALRPGGYLLLGLSETVNVANDLFTPVSREQHLYRSRPVPPRPYPVPESVPRPTPELKPATTRRPERVPLPGERIQSGDLYGQLLKQVAPPTIVVNQQYDILHLSERAGRYLHFAEGELAKNLLQVIRPELRLELRTAFYQTSQQQTSIQLPPLSLSLDGQLERVLLQVRPVQPAHDPTGGYFLVQFEPLPASPDSTDRLPTPAGPLAHHLEEELIRVREQLTASNIHYERQAEDLKAANEELQATNEELRSATEELETGKEELQSINEELSTVNQELKVKIEEISLSSNNLRNLINATRIATLFLDPGFRINLFTPPAGEIFNLIPSDYGRRLSDITHRLAYDQLLGDAAQVLASAQAIEREVGTTDGRSFIMHVLPYRTSEERISGVVITFIDISQRQQAEESLRQSEEQFRLFVLASSDSLFKMSADWQLMYQLEGMQFLADTSEPTQSWLEQYIPSEDHAQVQATIQAATDQKNPFEFEHRIIRRDGSVGWTLLRAIPILDSQGEVIEWFGAASNISERKEAEASLKTSARQKDEFLALLAHELRNPMATLANALLLLESTHGTDAQLSLVTLLPMMSREVAHLNRLVDDLLDISRINQGKLNLRLGRLDLTQLVQQVVTAMRPVVELAQLELQVQLPQEPVIVEGDGDRLTQVLRNLLGNAIKFTPASGRIALHLETVSPQAQLRVLDTGIGLAASELSRIFLMFAQVDTSRTRSQGGLGLGLTLTQDIVRLHGGQVQAYSDGLGQGSEFRVTLPLVAP